MKLPINFVTNRKLVSKLGKIFYKGILFTTLFTWGLVGCASLPEAEQISEAALPTKTESLPQSLEQIQNRGAIVIGTALTKPFEFHDPETDALVGFDVDIARHIAQKLNVDIEWVEMPFANLIPALEANKVNMTIAAMYITPEREALVDFAEPYLDTGLVIVLRPEWFDQIKSVQDLSGLKVGVKIGATGATLAEDLVSQGIDLEIVEYKDTFDSLLDLEVGRVDVVFNDYLNTLTYLMDYESQLQVATDESGEINFLSHVGLGIAIQPDNQALLAVINTALNEMQQDGTIQRLYEIWLTPATNPQSQFP